MIIFLFSKFYNPYFEATIPYKKFNVDNIIKNASKKYNVPENILKAIINVESEFNNYAVYGAKKTNMCKSEKEANHIVKQLKAKNFRNINVGLMQINLEFHNLNKPFDEKNNIHYGAKFLRHLYDRFGSWKKAVGYFHAGSKTKFYDRYFKKINKHLNGRDIQKL